MYKKLIFADLFFCGLVNYSQSEVNPVNCRTILEDELINLDYRSRGISKSQYIGMLNTAADMCAKEKMYWKMKAFSQKAANLGNALGMANLSVAYAHLNDVYNAIKWAEKSCKNGFYGGCDILDIYHNKK